jgi:hypothetical protein
MINIHLNFNTVKFQGTSGHSNNQQAACLNNYSIGDSVSFGLKSKKKMLEKKQASEKKANSEDKPVIEKRLTAERNTATDNQSTSYK